MAWSISCKLVRKTSVSLLRMWRWKGIVPIHAISIIVVFFQESSRWYGSCGWLSWLVDVDWWTSCPISACCIFFILDWQSLFSVQDLFPQSLISIFLSCHSASAWWSGFGIGCQRISFDTVLIVLNLIWSSRDCSSGHNNCQLRTSIQMSFSANHHCLMITSCCPKSSIR